MFNYLKAHLPGCSATIMSQIPNDQLSTKALCYNGVAHLYYGSRFGDNTHTEHPCSQKKSAEEDGPQGQRLVEPAVQHCAC